MALRNVVSALAGIFIGLFAPSLILSIRNISSSKTTGLTATAGGLTATLFTPWFWILAIFFFFLFFGASRLDRRWLRVLLFWVPATAISSLGIAAFALLVYARIHLRSG